MEEQRTKKCYNIFILMFITLNVLATYFVTTQSLNRYIINFNYTFKGIMNSIIGNVAFLLLVVLIVSVAFKKVKSRIVTLLLITLLLNGGLFAINVYNRFYGTSFTFKALAILKNPAEGFGLSLVFESLRELVTYYRIILFIPIIVLVIIYSVLKRKVNFNTVMPNNTIKQTVTKTLTVVALFLTNILVFSTEVQGKEIVDSAKATYATQNIGLYNYLFLDVIGFDYNSDEISIQDVKDVLDSSNKNKDVYTNILDGKEYTKEVSFKNSANVSGALVENLNPEDSLTGLLSGYNLVLIHLESFNHFLLELNQVNKYLYNLQALMSESYVFENFFTNVGLGTSFDAEIAVLTGLLPNGTSTLGWDYNEELEDKSFDFVTLPKLFRETNYFAYSFHGNNEIFYNRKIVHPNMFGFNQYYGKDTILSELGYEDQELGLMDLKEQYQHDSGAWISDRTLFNFFNDKVDTLYKENKQFMTYALTMLPHTPLL
ncbi:MAG: sulfatase-like hydrolase/transferase, partial [Acholeplasma sp.]|nr:sulfatase-like hydrolase/transferase [Acholeplasma sp.]